MEEDELKLSRFAMLLQKSKPIDANSRVASLLENEELNKTLLEKILSKSIRMDPYKLIANDGVTLIKDKKIYVGGANIENAYLVQDSDLRKDGIDVTKLRMNTLMRVSLEAKALIYVLCEEPKAKNNTYTIKISPIGAAKVSITPALSAEIIRLRYAKDPTGYI